MAFTTLTMLSVQEGNKRMAKNQKRRCGKGKETKQGYLASVVGYHPQKTKRAKLELPNALYPNIQDSDNHFLKAVVALLYAFTMRIVD